MSFRLEQIRHRFGDLVVLDQVDLAVRPGEVHALLGENGAGKSTLMHIAYGMLRPEAGSVVVGDARMPGGFASPARAREAGIGMVHQHFTSIGSFTVAENIALAGGWRETGRGAARRAASLVARVGLPLEVDARAEALSVSGRQRLEILKALAADARVLLLDEPTAVLAPREVADLERAVRAFADDGGTVLLITHKLPEVLAMADRVTVLRRGRVVLHGAVADESAASLARAMMGAEPVERTARTGSAPAGGPLVVAEALTLRRTPDAVPAVAGARFVCRGGEITGIAALEGNGQHELLRAIAGVGEVIRAGGTLEVTGPVAFVPEDRTTEALIPGFTLGENFLLGTLGGERWIDWRGVRARTAALLESFDVRAAGPDAPARSLSGGNQQKFVFARAFAQAPRVLVCEQPTRGLDLRATAAIHARLRSAADQGLAVIVHAADLDEVLAIADRVLVMAGGAVRAMPPGASRDIIGDAMLGIGEG